MALRLCVKDEGQNLAGIGWKWGELATAEPRGYGWGVGFSFLKREAPVSRRIFWLLLGTGILKFIYVFGLTDYPNYVYSDFQGYWDRAVERLNGDEFNYNQWAIWPTLPHITLTWCFRILGFLQMSLYRLEFILFANVVLSTASVFLLYEIARRTIQSQGYAFCVALVFALTFPLIYFNAFVMSEHPAVFFLLVALWLAISFHERAGLVWIAGLLLGFSVALRPVFGLFGLPFFIYLVLKNASWKRGILRAGIFSVGFFLVVGGAVLENARISKGKLWSLGANGGLNFYFGQCQTFQVTSEHDGYLYTLVPPGTVTTSENGHVRTHHPFEDQGFFYKQGLECLRAKPNLWLDRLENFRELFFGALLPSSGSALGFNTLFKPFRWFLFLCAVTLPLSMCLWKLAGGGNYERILIGGLLVCSALTSYFFSAEHRYLWPLAGLIYLLCIPALRAFSTDRRRAIRYSIGYFIILGTVAGGVRLATAMKADSHLSSVQMTIFKMSVPNATFPETSDGTIVRKDMIQKIHFPVEYDTSRLVSDDGEDFGSLTYVTVDFEACMEVAKRGVYEFQVISDDGFSLKLGGLPLMSFPGTRWYGPSRQKKKLEPGRYPYRLHYFQAGGPMGIVATWRYVESPEADYHPALDFHYIGESGREVRFLSLEHCQY